MKDGNSDLLIKARKISLSSLYFLTPNEKPLNSPLSSNKINWGIPLTSNLSIKNKTGFSEDRGAKVDSLEVLGESLQQTLNQSIQTGERVNPSIIRQM